MKCVLVLLLLFVQCTSKELKSDQHVILVKVGGSSITKKGTHENLNDTALSWFAETLSSSIGPSFRAKSDLQCNNAPAAKSVSFIIVHGAGSFGHFEAKEYGLKGPTKASTNATLENGATIDVVNSESHRHQMKGLAETRRSVTKLNHMVVSGLLQEGINAVGISPCFGVPGLYADANNDSGGMDALEAIVIETLHNGLVPVLHGDACLYGTGAAILSGDVLMEKLGKASWISQIVFITDVDGVFSEDPRKHPEKARLLKSIAVSQETGEVSTSVDASSSSHEHDVTGGLKAKLHSAAVIAQSGKNVTIVKCGSESAAEVLRGKYDVDVGSVVFAR